MILAGIGFIVFFFILVLFILPTLGLKIEFLSSPTSYILVLAVGIPLMLSGFLPYNWGKMIREISYLCFFGLLLLLLMNVVKFVSPTPTIQIDSCGSAGVLPSREQLKDNIFHNVMSYVSCVLTGKFPVEKEETVWMSFYLFHLLFPFFFVFVIIYGMMKSVDIGSIIRLRGVTLVMSTIISLYAMRTLLGGFILEFFGYTAWGMVGVIISIFLTVGFRNFIEKMLKIEKVGQEVRESMERVMDFEREFATTAKIVIDSAYTIALRMKDPSNPKELGPALKKLEDIKRNPFWSRLSESTQQIILEKLDDIKSSTSQQEFITKIYELLSIIESLKKQAHTGKILKI